ncbi:MAG: AAA family ATPase, partial [Acidobacteriota bacterium]
MFDKLEINNFKCFKEVRLKDLSRINVLVGENASGKTAFLESLFLMSGAGPELAIRLNIWRGVLKDRLALAVDAKALQHFWIEFFSDLDTEHPISISGVDSSRGDRSLVISLGSEHKELSLKFSEDLAVPLYPVKFVYSLNGQEIFTCEFASSGEVKVTGQLSAFPVVFLSPTNPHPGDDTSRFSDLSRKKAIQDVKDALMAEFPDVSELTLESPANENQIYADLNYLPEKISVGLVSAGL